MYLKNIEIHGFKSFARKITFDFHEGITGIVGPNGSGKSNVADAVRWVFGEQKVKQLRGGSMQDVIFAGTELRKPLSYASVSITLDNSDHQLAVSYEEVTITRKLYRSGESEYAINGSTCRLKDINEMFYDTGIGKEGYSIIGQGQIDKILSGRPEERRELFDEAVGIVKFKRRKNMSVKKLEDERQNLIRVSDILSELEKQVGPLERQSNIAKEYLLKKEELKIYDINMFLVEAERIKALLVELDAKITIVQSEYEESNASYESMKDEYEVAEEEIEETDDIIEHLKQQLNETNMLRQQLEGKIGVLKEQINTVKMNDEHIGQRLTVIVQEIESRNVAKAELDGQLLELKEQLKNQRQKNMQAKLSLEQVQLDILETSNTIDEKKQKIIHLLNERSSTKARIQRFDTMLEQGQIRKSQLSRQLIEMQTEKSKLEDILKTLKEAELTMESTIHEQQLNIAKIESEIQVEQQRIQERTSQLREGQIHYHREQSRLDALKNMTERYDGYGNSIRKVMERKAQMPGLLGVVADLIKTQKQYEVAIETALGGNIQNVVTDNESTAKQMIQYLKQNKLGRATFLPLTSIKGGQNIRYPEVLKEKGVIGLASTLVQMDAKYSNLAENLLGRTIVVESIDIGIALAKKYHQTLRIVTTEGELMNPGGSITGGAFKNTSNLLGRRREIDELEKYVSNLYTKMESLDKDVESAKAKRTQSYMVLDESKKELQIQTVEQNTQRMKIQQLEGKLQELTQSFLVIQRENTELDEQNVNIVENVDSIKIELETSESLELQITEEIQKLQAHLEIERERESESIHTNETIHLALASMEQKYEFVKADNNRIDDEVHKFNLELESLSLDKGDVFEEIESKNKQIREITGTIEESKELVDEINQEIQKSMKQREALNTKHKALIYKREETSKHISQLDKELFRLNNQREGMEESAEKNINYMWEEYEITYNYALELRDKNMTDLEAMKRSIKELKAGIKALGPVNVNAIEDYKELSERHIFLKTQHDDLIEAEKTLVDIIQELDAAMREQFQSQFALINNEYDKVFKQLFGGGKGTLELMEHEDVLEAGIRIIAQPPGKKLQNMMQLSGGEKALTAISLLFAIQNLKPSPFCLLDEIEAALDDSNVVRFAQYLHKLTKNTQFIVITHRRGTMTSADRLYGITMQEKGVSTLVSVDLLQGDLEE